MLTRYAQRNLTWIDLVAPTPAEVRALMSEFGIDPLIAEELMSVSFRSKVERRGDTVYAVLHFPAVRGAARHGTQEIDFVIGKHFLITTRYETIDPLHSFAKAFEVSSVLGHGGATHGGHLFASMLRQLYQALGSECDLLLGRLQDIEEKIFGGDERAMVVELSHTGRTIHDFRQSLAPHSEMLASLEPALARFFGPEYSYYIREAQGSHERVLRTLENLRDSLGELRATNNSLLTTKQNEAIKIFTMMAFITFPLSLLVAIFSMPARYVPLIGTPNGFWIITGLLAVLAASFLLFFKHKGWI
ncbi:MAG: magnesium transporter CorA family protein [Patescibacteria group bacterium]|nr:magnesium transporter CorA family protein [Patescibacteria group bacterium]